MQLLGTDPSSNNSSASLRPPPSDAIHVPPLPVNTCQTPPEPTRLHSKPCECWETAYLFAFIFKFTSLCHTLKTGLKLRTVQDLETILETDTRIVQSESSEQLDAHISSAKEILTEILIAFHENLKTLNLNSWSKWLKSFVGEILKYESQKPLLAILKWPQNYISTRTNGFWDLDWFEKVHLLRILVDHQLTYSPKIRAIIDENYDKSFNRILKPSSGPSISNQADGSKTIQNQLLIQPLGLDRDLKTWWQIDDSPRIYSSGNLYKSDCSWTVLSTTQAELTELMNKLHADPETVQKRQSSNSTQPPSAANATNTASKKVTIPAIFTKNNRRKKQSPVDISFQLECKLSKAIAEVALSNIEAGEQRVQGLIKERDKIEERQMRKQQKIALANSQAPLTRETPGFGVRSRLRSQLTKPDYVVDSDEIDRQLELALRVSEGSNEGSDSGRKGKSNKRKRKGKMVESEDSDHDGSDYQTGSLVGTNEADSNAMVDDGTECDRPTRKRGSTVAKKVASTAQGERRSTRVRLKVENEPEEQPKPIVEKEKTQPQASTWSRSQPPISPSISESLEESCTEPTATKDNVSVWSRGKLIYVAGNNKYASKAVLPPQHNSETTEEKPQSGNETNETGANWFSAFQLRARLATIGGVDDDGDHSKVEQKEGSLLDDHQNRSEPSRSEFNFDESIPANGSAEDDARPPVLDSSLVSPLQSPKLLIQFDQDNHPAHPLATR